MQVERSSRLVQIPPEEIAQQDSAVSLLPSNHAPPRLKFADQQRVLRQLVL